jgi:hypothetical protein
MPEGKGQRLQLREKLMFGPPLSPGPLSAGGRAGVIAAAIAGTSNNTNSVPTMNTPFTNDPSTLADMELMRANYNALVLALRR